MVEAYVDSNDASVAWVDGLGFTAITYAYTPTGAHRILDFELKQAPDRVASRIVHDARLVDAARRAFAALGVEGYGRADFRVTPDAVPTPRDESDPVDGCGGAAGNTTRDARSQPRSPRWSAAIHSRAAPERPRQKVYVGARSRRGARPKTVTPARRRARCIAACRSKMLLLREVDSTGDAGNQAPARVRRGARGSRSRVPAGSERYDVHDAEPEDQERLERVRARRDERIGGAVRRVVPDPASGAANAEIGGGWLTHDRKVAAGVVVRFAHREHTVRARRRRPGRVDPV